MIGVYPGSFDPCTNGHIDIIERSALFVDKLVVVVLNNKSKKYLLEEDERVDYLKLYTSKISNVEVHSFDGFIVDFAEKVGAGLIIRGVRNNSDFEFEYNIYFNNKKLDSRVETVFLPATLENIYISSSNVKEIASFGGDISHMVPEEVRTGVLSKYNILED